MIASYFCQKILFKRGVWGVMAVIWELDFYSRPILDENQKRIWELLICDRNLKEFTWVKECPSDTVNSAWLAQELSAAIAAYGQAPQKIRFFRPSMSNIILRGCKQAGLIAQASRRVFSLTNWLQERMETVYPQHPGFQAPDPQPLPLKVDQITPQPLPNALMGDRWLYVSLAAQDLATAAEWSMDFGEVFSIELSQVAPDLVVPGLIIISSRALPLAAWMSGVDPVFLQFSHGVIDKKTQLFLDAGADAKWLLSTLQFPKDEIAISEAEKFEADKQKANGLHFLAVQKDPNIEHFNGFWLLKEV